MDQFEIDKFFKLSPRGGETVPYDTLIQDKCYTCKSLQEVVAFAMRMGRYVCE